MNNLEIASDIGPGRPSLGSRVGRRWLPAVLGLAVAMAAGAAFLPVLDNGFAGGFDDDENFLDNVDYRGLNWSQIGWAWRTFKLGVYQPLAWILLEIQYAMFGLAPRGYHLASLLMHAAVAVALYVLTATILARSLRPASESESAAILVGSSLAAILFAVHPLRVEVVAWASCQPYLPCALFSHLAILAYLRACDDPGATRPGWLAASWLLFLLALLSKAVAVTLPAVLVILDIAVLRRIDRGNWMGPSTRRVWLEKVPFLALSVVFQVLAILAKRSNESLISIRNYGLPSRIVQSCYSTAFYLVKTIWPAGLCAYYPLPRPVARLWTTGYLTGIPLVVGATLIVILLRRRRTGLLACWAAFLIILSPNMGLLRISNQIAADRYSYFASMSLMIPVAFALSKWIRSARSARGGATAPVCVVLALACILGGLSWRACPSWHDEGALWANASRQGYRDNPTVLVNLGMAEERRGRFDEAKAYYNEAIRRDPSFPDAHNILGSALDREGRTEESEALYARALRLDPEYPAAQNNLGSMLARRGQLEAAIDRFGEAVRLKPDFALARKNLAKALIRTGRIRRGLAEFAEAARLAPDDGGVRNDYGRALAQAGRIDEALARFAEAARLDPRSAAIQINWGLALEQSRRPTESIVHFAAAARLEPDRVDNHLLLAEALARRGDVREAASELETALRLDPGNREATERLRELRASDRR
jgi:protein O-mannosyl-transferase